MGLSRLLWHTTTIDPYLDESGPSARRLGLVTLGGVAVDALTLAGDGLSIELRTPARGLLRIPCAVTGPARGAVIFELRLDTRERENVRQQVRIDPGRHDAWHMLDARVPPGLVRLTLHARGDGDADPSGALAGVPSFTWRKSARAIARSIGFAVRHLGIGGTWQRVRQTVDDDPSRRYAAWQARHTPTADDLARARAAAAAVQPRPRFALLIDTAADGDPALVATTRASLEAQVYGEWEVWPVRGAASRNEALAQSRADFVAAVDAGDRLSPLALLRAAEHAAPAVDVIYTDEDVWPAGDAPREPRFKPDWSPEYLLAGMYLGRLCLIRREHARAVEGYRAEMDGALDYDLALRACAEAHGIVHVPEVLLHRHAGGAGCPDSDGPAAARALANACARRHLTATVVPGALPGIWRARVTPLDRPRIAIVIPTDGRRADPADEAFVVQCLRAVASRTRYTNYEILICDNGNLDEATRAALAALPHRRVTYTWDGAFNFPRKLNFAVAQTHAPYLLLMNDDIEPINGEWLDAMLEYAHQPEIGAVGAKLFYPDGRLQHVGVAVGVCGIAAHLLHQQPGGTQGGGGIAVTPHNCSAVTGACLLTRRAIYDRAGGFDEALALDFNDVDFCLRVRAAGYRIVFTPHARLFHHESGSFGHRRQRAEEIETMRRRWHDVLASDPYYNVNLSRAFADCRPVDDERRA